MPLPSPRRVNKGWRTFLVKTGECTHILGLCSVGKNLVMGQYLDSKEAGKGPPWLGPAKTGGGVSFTRRRKERSNVERVALPHKCVRVVIQ